ncbi:MAG: hypothetical protein ACLGHT_11125 [Acidimicrobiia bacterium]
MQAGRCRCRGDDGNSVLLLALTIVTVVIAGGLVFRVGWTANSINQKAGRIAKTAVPINEATDAVLNLDETNSLAGSINETAKPLQEKLAEIVRLAQAVDEVAGSIDGVAGEIDGTAGGINTTAAGVLDVAKSIDRGVAQINRNLDVTIGIANAIKGDTANILGNAGRAHVSAACIDKGLNGAATSDGHCQ